MSAHDIGNGRAATPSLLDNRIPPPAMTLITGIAMGAASAIVPATAMPPLIRFGMLGAVMLVGGVFGARAFAAFARAKTTINPVDITAASSLVTTGIYAVSRNPMYVGLTALLVALALALSNAWLLLGRLFFAVFTTRFQIIPEERAMLAKFGADYIAYRRRVRRWPLTFSGRSSMANPKILITGATGKTGAAVIGQLLDKGLSLRALVRQRDARSVALEKRGVEVVIADMFDPDQMLDAMRGTQRAYYLPMFHTLWSWHRRPSRLPRARRGWRRSCRWGNGCRTARIPRS